MQLFPLINKSTRFRVLQDWIYKSMAGGEKKEYKKMVNRTSYVWMVSNGIRGHKEREMQEKI